MLLNHSEQGFDISEHRFDVSEHFEKQDTRKNVKVTSICSRYYNVEV